MRRYDGIAENGDSVLFLAIANKDVAVEQKGTSLMAIQMNDPRMSS